MNRQPEELDPKENERRQRRPYDEAENPPLDQDGRALALPSQCIDGTLLIDRTPKTPVPLQLHLAFLVGEPRLVKL